LGRLLLDDVLVFLAGLSLQEVDDDLLLVLEGLKFAGHHFNALGDGDR